VTSTMVITKEKRSYSYIIVDTEWRVLSQMSKSGWRRSSRRSRRKKSSI